MEAAFNPGPLLGVYACGVFFCNNIVGLGNGFILQKFKKKLYFTLETGYTGLSRIRKKV